MKLFPPLSSCMDNNLPSPMDSRTKAQVCASAPGLCHWKHTKKGMAGKQGMTSLCLSSMLIPVMAHLLGPV